MRMKIPSMFSVLSQPVTLDINVLSDRQPKCSSVFYKSYWSIMYLQDQAESKSQRTYFNGK